MNSIAELFFGPLLQSPLSGTAPTGAHADPAVGAFALSLNAARAAAPAAAAADPGDAGVPESGQDDPRPWATASPLSALPASSSDPVVQPGNGFASGLTQTGNRLPSQATESGNGLPPVPVDSRREAGPAGPGAPAAGRLAFGGVVPPEGSVSVQVPPLPALSMPPGIAPPPPALLPALMVLPQVPGPLRTAEPARAMASAQVSGSAPPGPPHAPMAPEGVIPPQVLAALPPAAEALPVEALRGPWQPIAGAGVAAAVGSMPATATAQPRETPPADAGAATGPRGGAPGAGAAAGTVPVATADGVSAYAAGIVEAPNERRAVDAGSVGPVRPGDGTATGGMRPESTAALLERFHAAAVGGGDASRLAPGGDAGPQTLASAAVAPRPDLLPAGDGSAALVALDRRALLEAAGRQRPAREPGSAVPDTVDRSVGSVVDPGDQRAQTTIPRPVLPTFAPRDLHLLAERIEMLAHGRLGRASVSLNLGELGDVEIRVRMESRQAHVQFVVQDAAVREALESQLPRLRTLLAEGGLDLGDVAANLQGRGDEGAQRESMAGNPRGMDDPTGREPTSGTLPEIRRRTDGNRLLDAFA